MVLVMARPVPLNRTCDVTHLSPSNRDMAKFRMFLILLPSFTRISRTSDDTPGIGHGIVSRVAATFR
ncbi:hypothetical protein DNTS_035035 [Danionella cerebrum]|uniref:Uncharacterized protein n=1 Tax=Danionella cerebrum TaxID=2873325 RepID=A0A553MRL0_9TELE|nr:hypothetical protein DNTS_035035 [Danionella translucida]